MSMRSVLLLLGMFSFAFGQDWFQGAQKRDFVTLVSAPAIKVASTGTTKSRISFRVKPEMHVNSHTPHSDLLIPTELEVKPTGGIDVKVSYPAGQDIALDFDPTEKLNVYTGDFAIEVTAAARHAKPGTLIVPASLKYQACNATSCFPPKSVDFNLEVHVNAAR